MPTPQSPLGEFEVVVLLAVLHLTARKELAYGSPIRDEIERRGGRPVSPERKLRPRRLFRVTPPGLRAVRQSMGLIAKMQRGLEPVLGAL